MHQIGSYNQKLERPTRSLQDREPEEPVVAQSKKLKPRNKRDQWCSLVQDGRPRSSLENHWSESTWTSEGIGAQYPGALAVGIEAQAQEEGSLHSPLLPPSSTLLYWGPQPTGQWVSCLTLLLHIPTFPGNTLTNTPTRLLILASLNPIKLTVQINQNKCSFKWKYYFPLIKFF